MHPRGSPSSRGGVDRPPSPSAVVEPSTLVRVDAIDPASSPHLPGDRPPAASPEHDAEALTVADGVSPNSTLNGRRWSCPVELGSARRRARPTRSPEAVDLGQVARPAPRASRVAPTRPGSVARFERRRRLGDGPAELARSGRRTGRASGAGGRRAATPAGRPPRTGPPRGSVPRNERACWRRSASCRRRSIEDLLATEDRRDPDRRRTDDRGAEQRPEHPEHLDADRRAADHARGWPRRPTCARPSNVGPPCHSVATSNDDGRPDARRARTPRRASRPAIVAWIAAAPSVASRNAARTAAAVSAWMRWLTSGQARAGIDPLDLVLERRAGAGASGPGTRTRSASGAR